MPVAPQPEATQARSNSRRHTMQTADQNRMDTCWPRLRPHSWAHIKDWGAPDVIPASDRGITRSEEKRPPCLWMYRMCVRAYAAVYVHLCSHVYERPVCRVLRGAQWSVGSTVTTAHPWRALCLPSRSHASYCKLPLSQLLWHALQPPWPLTVSGC